MRTIRWLAATLAVVAVVGFTLRSAGSRADGATTTRVAPESLVALVNANVLPMDREEVLFGHTVILRNGRVEQLGPVAEVTVPDGAEVIDAGGHFAIPGLSDMHVHLPGTHTEWRQMAAMYLANGVTTILNLDGAAGHLGLRTELANGDVLGPRLFTSGPTMRNGRGAAASAQEVRRQQASGYDVIKVYSFLPQVDYDAVMSEADALGIPVIGHAVRPAGAISAALVSGQHIAHMEEFIYGWFRDGIDESTFPQRPPAAAARALAVLLDRSRIDDLAGRVANAGLFVVPNLVAYHYILEQVRDLDTMLQRPEVSRMPESILAGWQMPNNRYASRDNLARFEAILGTSYPFLQELTGAFGRAGVALMLGSDAPVAVVVPGFDTLDELDELVAAGLTPYAALRAATVTPGAFLQKTARSKAAASGTIRVGDLADIVLLERNPLEDIRATRTLHGVVVLGRWYSRAALAERTES